MVLAAKPPICNQILNLWIGGTVLTPSPFAVNRPQIMAKVTIYHYPH